MQADDESILEIDVLLVWKNLISLRRNFTILVFKIMLRNEGIKIFRNYSRKRDIFQATVLKLGMLN